MACRFTRFISSPDSSASKIISGSRDVLQSSCEEPSANHSSLTSNLHHRLGHIVANLALFSVKTRNIPVEQPK